MHVTSAPRPLRRAAADAVLGLVLFVGFSCGLLGMTCLSDMAGQARAAELARVAAFTGPIVTASTVEKVATRPAILVSARSTIVAPLAPDQTMAIGILATVFAVLFAFNLAFFRHLRHVYAAPEARPRTISR